jgi:hypothetical protein
MKKAIILPLVLTIPLLATANSLFASDEAAYGRKGAQQNYAENVVNDVADGTSDAIKGTGKAVEHVGKAAGDVVEDTAKGVDKAVKDILPK